MTTTKTLGSVNGFYSNPSENDKILFHFTLPSLTAQLFLSLVFLMEFLYIPHLFQSQSYKNDYSFSNGFESHCKLEICT